MGFDVELADGASRKEANVCPHCHLILEEPFQTDEGVRLCKSCLLEIKSKPGGRCSCCGVTVADGQYYADKAAQREVNAIQVVCRFRQFNCPWKGNLKDYKAHVESCEFAGVSCPNTGCEVMVLSSQLDKHLAECDYRTVQCDHCHEKMIAKQLESHHATQCTMYPVVCERCQERLPHRHLLPDHLLTSCKFEECLVCQAIVERNSSRNAPSATDSPQSSAGSTDEGTVAKSQQTPTSVGTKKSGSRSESRRQKQPRKGEKSAGEKLAAEKSAGEKLAAEKSSGVSEDVSVVTELMGEEEKGGLHLGQPVTVFRHMQTLAADQRELRTDFKSFRQDTESRLAEWGTRGASDSAETSSDTQELIRMLEQKMAVVSEEAERERKRRSEMERRLQQLQRELEAAEQKASDAFRKTEKNSREIESVRQTAQSVGGVKGGKSGRGGGWDVGGSSVEERLMRLEQRTEQQERETSTLKVNLSELELQLQASLASTHNGSFLWRIPEVARRRRDAIDERITSIYSPPFYTGRNGYKMCIRAYLNGDGIGYKTHFSVFFVLMRGEFDPLLKWPFEYKVSLILVDQEHRKHIVQTFKPTPESSSFKRPTTDMNVASGCPQFAKLSVLDEVQYTKDDVIYLKCIIDTSRIFHP